jgi:hypothetical protein
VSDVIPSNEETQAKDAQIERFAETLSEAYGLLERAHSILSIREGAMKTAKGQALLSHIARFMDGFPPETVCELNALERLLVEWWNSDMESAELFNRAVLTNPALASAMNTDRCKSGGTDGSCALHEGHGGPHALRSPEKAGAFCSRCGGTDPACYICGSNAQKTSERKTDGEPV